MKKLILGLLLLVCFNGWGQKDGLEFTNRRAVADTVFGLLNPRLYGNSLIDRSLTEDSILIKEIRGDYNVISSGYSWLQAYSDIAVSYTDPKYMLPDTVLIEQVKETCIDLRLNADKDQLIQPFALLLHQTSKMDTTLYDKNERKNGFVNQRNQLKLKANYKEESIYHSVLLKSAALMEFYGEHGYKEGTIVYDPKWISNSPDIKVASIQLDLGSGFQQFGERNKILTYRITEDWQVGKAAIVYYLKDKEHRDTLSFYLSTETYKYHTRGRHRFDDEHFTFPGNTPDINHPLLSWAVRYGCGNHNKIRRPVIIVPPYAPLLQTLLPSVNFEKYWDQFDYKSIMSYLSDMGYDVIFIKEVPGNSRLANAGDEIVKFINYINQVKRQNYPNEDWENIVIGYSAGGQQVRYALKKLEKEHMDGNGPAHHCRLYIPFDSPHWGANVPMFTQAVYNDFNINVLAIIGRQALNDPASRDMLMNHYLGSDITQSNNDYNITPHPTVKRKQFMNQLMNDFNHQYTPTNDLRKSFPNFTRNIAISTGKNDENYTGEFGLSPGMELFKQNFAYPAMFGIKKVNRRINASEYSSLPYIFKRKDIYMVGFVVPIITQRYYRTNYAYEWDMAQGGYKDIFYNGLAGATTICRSGTFFLGTTLYKDHVSFLPLVSALAIDTNIWKDNNLYYNVKSKGLMYNKFDYTIGVDESNFFGYPNLAHPNDHFNITPFEAIYCDLVTSEHIKMQKSAGNNQTKNDDLVHLRDFILNEVEAKTVYFQNQDMGINHAPNDNNFTYTAWYKAEDEIIIGNSVTPKTDPGPYIIESTANITMYACNGLNIKSVFHAKSGSTFHAFVKCDYCKGPVRPLYPDENSSMSTGNGTSIESQNKLPRSFDKDELQVFPNPSSGTVNVIFPERKNGRYQLSNIQGKLIKSGDVGRDRKYIFQLPKGTYILKWINNNEVQTRKIIVL